MNTRLIQYGRVSREYLHKWGQSWRAASAKAKPPIPPDVWRAPDDWAPPERKSGWPDTGKVRVPILPD